MSSESGSAKEGSSGGSGGGITFIDTECCEVAIPSVLAAEITVSAGTCPELDTQLVPLVWDDGAQQWEGSQEFCDGSTLDIEMNCNAVDSNFYIKLTYRDDNCSDFTVLTNGFDPWEDADSSCDPFEAVFKYPQFPFNGFCECCRSEGAVAFDVRVTE